MKRAAAFTILLLCCVQVTDAAESTSGPFAPAHEVTDSHQWVVQVTPYLWAAGLDGRISPFRRGPAVDADKPFRDVLDDLNFGGFANLWIRRDRFVFSGDVMYVNTTDARASGPLPAFQIPGFGISIPPEAAVSGSVNTEQLMAALQGGYRVVDTPRFTLDALAGVRFWHISNELKVTAEHAAIGRRTASHGESFGWADPLVGLRAFVPMTEQLSIQAQADVGGFGAGADLTWSVLATANYTLNDRLSLSAGYKALKVDYDHGGHVYDVLLSGPVLGMTLRF
ncbi:hypothetical protein [Pannonibacter indicus]|uniref:hypothetical protein n=1 Tax=Pannonibacter indicus TaxID=466044 RepID=UPI0035AF6DB5